MSDQARPPHEEWEELAAASALDALDPDEAQRLAAHVATCEICQQDLDDYSLIAAQLGSLADDEETAPSWQRMRSVVIGAEPAGGQSATLADRHDDETPHEAAPVIPLARQASTPAMWRRPRVLTAAAAVVLLLAGGLVGWRLSSRSSPASATAAVTACQQQAGCRVVKLRSGSVADSAAVIVDAGHASVVPISLTNAPSGRMYVLWQLPKDGGGVMIPIQSFWQTKRQTAGTPLPHSYADTAAFAISLEPAGQQLPTRPSGILALGAAT